MHSRHVALQTLLILDRGRAELAAGLAQVEAFVRRGGGLQQAGEELEGLVL